MQGGGGQRDTIVSREVDQVNALGMSRMAIENEEDFLFSFKASDNNEAFHPVDEQLGLNPSAWVALKCRARRSSILCSAFILTSETRDCHDQTPNWPHMDNTQLSAEKGRPAILPCL